MRLWKKLTNQAWRLGFALLAVQLMLFCTHSANAQNNAEFQTVRVSKIDNNLAVSAQIKFDLPTVIEEAMYKGVSLTFVSEAAISRERWYWFDKEVTTVARQIRISYQALTRRWRVTPWTVQRNAPGAGFTSANLGVQLAQTYDSLDEAISVAQRITNWRIAPLAELSDNDYTLQLRYRLDMSQLPKTLVVEQLGKTVFGGGDWVINAQMRLRVNPSELRADAP